MRESQSIAGFYITSNPFSLKFDDVLAMDDVPNLDRTAADFAVFGVGLAANGHVENHRYLFAAIWASKEVFHLELVIDISGWFL